MDLLGPSLDKLFTFCEKRFTLKTVLMIANQLLQRLEFIHSKSLIYRNLKPENIVIGMGATKVISIFYLSIRYDYSTIV